jgi:hypothetical protein
MFNYLQKKLNKAKTNNYSLFFTFFIFSYSRNNLLIWEILVLNGDFIVLNSFMAFFL